MHRQGQSVEFESTNTRLRIRERVEWMVYHSNRGSSSEATTCNHQFSESEWWGFFTKGVWMYRFGKLTSRWNCVCRQYCTVHQCCAALYCIETRASCYNLRCIAEISSVKRQNNIGFSNILRFFSHKRGIFKYIWNVSSKSRLCLELLLVPDDDMIILI